jgi:Mn2+/Fe2+ NRAMP family transporter
MEEKTEKQKAKEQYYFASRKIDEEAFEKERESLKEINSRKLINKWRGYFKFTGPGFILSGLTLGAATAGSAIMAGSLFGYDLLWVNPLGRIFGIIVLAAIGYQVCFTGQRPYKVVWDKLHPALAIFWGINVLFAATIFQFPQYSLGAAVAKDIFAVFNINMPTWIVVVVFLSITSSMCWSYGTKRKSIILFEKTVMWIVWIFILALVLVILKTGVNWGETFKGFFFFKIPHDIKAIMIILGLLGASVGVNTTFIYPYMMLARKWVKEHNGLKDFDLVFSMLIPTIIVPSLLIIAVANTLHVKGIEAKNAVDVAHTLEPIIGLTTSRIVFSLGLLGKCLATMVIEMLVCGFVLAEMLGFDPRGWKFKVTTSVANVGILGAFMPLPFWVPVATSALNLVMAPIAFIFFFILQNRKDYLGENVNKGWRGYLWNFLMLVSIFISALGTAGYIIDKLF